jgi:hypothetical protein
MKTLALILLAVLFVGCASMPEETHPSNFLDVGKIYPKFRGNTFYMATGQVELYKYGFWGNLEKTGRTIDMAVAIQADPDSGEVQRIAALQPTDAYNGIIGRAGYSVSDLKGGILLTDFQPYPHWLDAITSMEAAVDKLNPAMPDYGTVAQSNGTVVFIEGPPVYAWGWGWRYHHYYYYHRRPFY